jgi:hypothetical protein
VKNIKAHASDSVQVVLVGNKTDLRHGDDSRVYVETEQGRDVALKFGIPFFETSAKESHNVDSAFSTLATHAMQSTVGASPPRGQYFPLRSANGVGNNTAGGAAGADGSAASGSSSGAGGLASGGKGGGDGSGANGSSSSSGAKTTFGQKFTRKSIESGMSKVLGSIPNMLSRDGDRSNSGDKAAEKKAAGGGGVASSPQSSNNSNNNNNSNNINTNNLSSPPAVGGRTGSGDGSSQQAAAGQSPNDKEKCTIS